MNPSPNINIPFGAWFPILVPQLLYVRLTTDKLSEPPEQTGTCGASDGSLLNIAIIGESSAMGVGVSSSAQSLANVMGTILARELSRQVKWQLSGKSGATAQCLRRSHLAFLSSREDVVFLILGVNDVLRLRTTNQWRCDLKTLLSDIQRRIRNDTHLFVAAIPALETFPGIPLPARSILGKRAVLFNAITSEIASTFERVHFLKRSLHSTPHGFFCRDGIHPSESGYQLWGGELVMNSIGHLRSFTLP